jgi:hypothetical protein
VRVAIAHEFPWRATRHLPTRSQVAAVAKIASLEDAKVAARGEQGRGQLTHASTTCSQLSRTSSTSRSDKKRPSPHQRADRGGRV